MFKCPTLNCAWPTPITSISRFIRDDSGATAIEYALVASGIGVAIAASIVSLGSTVNGLFSSVATLLR